MCVCVCVCPQWEKLILELEEEQRLLLESKKRLQEATLDGQLSRAHMVSLQQLSRWVQGTRGHGSDFMGWFKS